MSGEGGTNDGDTYTLTCIASKDPGLVSPTEVKWVGPDGSTVSGTEPGVARSVNTTDSTTTLVLQFDPLSTSHGGRYTCQAVVQTVAIVEPLMETRSANLRIQSKCICVSVTSILRLSKTSQ